MCTVQWGWGGEKGREKQNLILQDGGIVEVSTSLTLGHEL